MLWLTNKNHFCFQTITRKILDYLLLPRFFFPVPWSHSFVQQRNCILQQLCHFYIQTELGKTLQYIMQFNQNHNFPWRRRSVSIIVRWRALDAGTQIKQHSDGGTSLLQTSWVLVKTSLPSINDIKSTDTRQCHMSWGWGIPNILAEPGVDGVRPLSPLTPGPETRLGSCEMMSSKNVH